MSEVLGKPQWIHFRLNDGKGVKSRGGATVCYLPSEDGKVGLGVALCSDKDNYCRRRGRVISQGRANSDLIHSGGKAPMTWDEFVSKAAEMVSEAVAKSRIQFGDALCVSKRNRSNRRRNQPA